MGRVLLVCPSPFLREHTLTTLGAIGLIDVLQITEVPELSEINAIAERIEICLVEVGSEQLKTLRAVERIASAGISTIALHATSNPELELECLRRGVSESIVLPICVAQLQHTLDRIAARRQYGRRPSRQPGAIYAAMAGKGGSGCTTVATHLALHLSQVPTNRTLLVDMDGISGSVNLLLKLKPAFSFLDCIADVDRLDDELWNKLLVRSGPLDVLAAPTEPTQMEASQRSLVHIFDRWRTSYDTIILDLPSSPTELSLECARQADMMLLVAGCDLASVYSTTRQNTYLANSGMRPNAVKMVLNRFRPSFMPDVYTDIVGQPVFARLSEAAEALERALMQGQPVPGRSRFATDIVALAERLTGKSVSTNRRTPSFMSSCRALGHRFRRKENARLSLDILGARPEWSPQPKTTAQEI